MSYINKVFSKPAYSEAKHIAEIINKHNIIGIVSHENPDADALGSMLALAEGLKTLGKTILLYNASPVPNYLKWLMGDNHIYDIRTKNSTKPDIIVILDCGDSSRLGNIEEVVLAYPTINIDHHLNNPHFASDYNWSDANMPATAHMVAAVLYAMNIPLNKNIAEKIITKNGLNLFNIFASDKTNLSTA